MVISDYERAKAIVSVTSGEYLGSFTDADKGRFLVEKNAYLGRLVREVKLVGV